MTRKNPVALPEDDYVLLIGQLAYTVSYLEWIILGDLPGLAQHVPASLTVSALAGKSTGQIAGALAKAAPNIGDDAVRAYVECAGRLLGEAANVRNDVLHARPATSPDHRQRLYRWRPATGQKRHSAFFIDTAWLERAIDQLSEAVSALSASRVRGR
ncbi:hypothetical protein [Mycolicibacter arupensis]|uniref:hypothetical protein n=1 Tax=Mycolicibacter arupensis TaxID=342002 RepID=UPI00122C3806|nr:hypothetical protein [Mycolicibacter arupensis]KAA1430443.1 hypothetical protein F0402_13995 [Mycolicibacter arupensis]